MGKSSQKEKREKRLAGRVSLALAAGMFSVVPVAHGMPTLDKIDTGAVKFDGATPNPGDVLASGAPITSDTKNNIIDWKDFSVAQGEHVNFADDNNYMNVVTGKATSAIDGILSSNGGDIYVINPNGVIFGKTAQVNVGNLYVSTRALTTDVKDEFLRGNSNTVNDGNGNPVASPICTPFSDVLTAINSNTASATADVVNLIDKNGYVAANKVVMEGKNIRFLNTASVAKADTIEVVTSTVDDVTTTTYKTTNTYVSGDTEHGFTIKKNNDVDGHLVTGSTDKSNIQLRADGYLHVGDGRNTGNMTGTDDAIHYTAKKTAGVNYALVRTAAELQAIRTNDSNANYMLANDINDATIKTPIGTAEASGPKYFDVKQGGTPFTGKFDGMFFTVENLNPSVTKKNTYYAGLFAYTKDATIENVGVSGAKVEAGHAGGIVGYADHTTLRNVWNAGGSNKIGDTWTNTTGGLVGVAANGTKIESSYNAGEVLGAGLVGTLNNSTITNAYNIGKLTSNGDSIAGIFSQAVGTKTNNIVKNTYTAAVYVGHSTGGTEKLAVTFYGGADATFENNYIIHSTTSYSTNYLGNDTNTGNTLSWKTYSGENNSGFNISSVGGEKTTWRIYEGSSLPMLTAFFRGTVSADYAYNDNGTEKFSSAAKNKTYDANMVDPYHYVSAANGDYVYKNGGYVRYEEGVDAEDAPRYARQDGAHYLGMNATGTTGSNNDGGANVTITESDNKNAGTFALFTGQQQGYDLCDNYFTINKRNIKFDLKNGSANKVYDGLSTNTVSGKGLVGKAVNADDASLPAIVEIADGVLDDVKVGGTVTYVYKTNGVADKNVGNKKVTITASGLKLEGASKDNYNATFIEPTEDVDAKITKRTLQVGLYNTTGINKTYDGTSAVTNENKGELEHGFIGAENLDTSTATNVDGDEAWLESQNRTIAQMLSDDIVGFSTSGVTSRYVKADLTTDAVNVADAAKVAYEGITLTGSVSALSNYQLSNGGTVYADGAIQRRSISLSDFSYSGTGGAITKTYDGTSTMNDASKAGHAVTVLNQVSQDPTAEISTSNTTKGLLQADAGDVKFITTGTATFYTDATGTTKAMDATDSGLAYAAKKAGYGVQLDTANLTEEAAAARRAVAANYIVEGVKIDEVDSSGANKSFDVMGAGRIEKRTVTVKLGKTTGIDKIYDGTTDVLDQYKTWDYVYADSDDTDAKKALKKLVSGDGATIGFTSATYDKPDVALDAQGEVLRKANGDEKDDTKAVTFKLAMGGSNKAANYILTTAAPHTDDTTQEVTLDATGKITQRELKVTFAGVKKVYDGDAKVTNTKTDTITPNIAEKTDDTGLTGNDTYVDDPTDTNFIFRLSGAAGIKGTYGDKDNNNVFTENKNIGEHDVKYTNLQTAIKSKNYKVSNTIYGKGIIQKKTIKSQDIDAATSIVNNTVLTKVYDGNDQNTQYIGRNAMGEKDTSGNVTSPAFLAWVENDDTIPDKDTLTITIAEAVYAGVDQGDYIYNKPTKTGGVALTFRISGSDAGNYEFEGADENGNLSMTKQGYKGHIDQRKVAVSLDATQNPTKQYDGEKDLRKADGTTIGNDVIKDWFTLSTVASETAADRPSGIVEDEDVVLQIISAQYKDANQNENATAAEKGAAVRYTLVLANGTNNKASNYTLVDTNGNTITQIDGMGTINKRQVFVSSVDNGMDKAYDGNGNVLPSADGKGVHISAVDGTTVGNGVLTTEGLNVIETAASPGAGKVAGLYGDLANGTFTANTAGNVKRATVNDPAGVQDIQYTGLVTALGSNYELYKKNGGSYTKDTSGIAYGTGTIELANIDLTNAYMDNTVRKEYNNSATIREEDAWAAIKNVDPKWKSLLTVDAKFSGNTNDVNVGTGKTIAATIALQSGGAALNYSISGATSKVLKNQDGTTTPTGEIYAKTLYAHLVESPTTGMTTKEYLTKTYDGTADLSATVLPNVISWVQLDTDSQTAITNINDHSGIGLATGITAKYVDTTDTTGAKDKNAATTKTVQFDNVVLANNGAGNYALVLYNTKDANNKPVATNKLTTTGAIDKKQVTITSFFDANDPDDIIERSFNGSAAVTATAINSLDPVLSGVLSGENVVLNTATDAEPGQLKGIYGTWTAATETTPATFTANSHVKYQNDDVSTGEVVKQDLLFYDLALTGDDAANYELANAQGPTVLNFAGNNIATTSYFQEATQRGKITPLAITMDNISSNYNGVEGSLPITIEKIYDNDTSVAGYNPTLGKNMLATDYFKVFYDAGETGGNGVYDAATDIYLTYSANANFDNKNAGADKTVTYSNFEFDTTTLGDFGISGSDLAYYYNHGETENHETYTNAGAAPNSGNIARRMLDVSVSATTPKNGDNTKIYDGKTLLIDTTTYPASNTYSANFQDPNNTGTTGLVGNDTVSITYVANFADTSANIDPNTQKDGEGWATKDVTYTFTLGAGDASGNYTLTEAGRYDDVAARTGTRTGTGAIRKREVYVEFQDSTGLDKMYDNDASLFVGKDADNIPVLADGRKISEILAVAAATDSTGIVASDESTGEVGQLDYKNVSAKYVNSSGIEDEDVATTTSGRITTKKVYFQNLNIVNSNGSANSNYVVKAKNGNKVGNQLPTATDAEHFDVNDKQETLVGTGTIQPRVIDLALSHTPVEKTFNGSAEVEDIEGGIAYRTGNLTVKAAGVTDGVQHYGLATGDNMDDLILESALYYDSTGKASGNAGQNLGVTYKLKWNSANYELVRTSIETKGNINKKQITLKDVDIETLSKTYDGTAALGKTESVLGGEMFDGVRDQDKAGLLDIDEANSGYAYADTNAAENSRLGAEQDVTIKYSLKNNNYVLSNGTSNGIFHGTGRIDRAPLTLVPTPVTYKTGDTIPTEGYAGTVTGFKNGENLADGYDVTFGRDANRATTIGNYNLLGYVNDANGTLLVPDANGFMYYNNPSGTTGNYYFVQQANNGALHIVPQESDMANAVQEAVIGDKKFTPDEYSYNRMSKDQDLTRVNRQSSATVQYAEKGVNVDEESRSGLAALADIQGAGSVVNLAGAVIQTSAPAEQPETVAAEAALPMPESEETDNSSIALEYASEGEGSQELLEILTNASRKAENKGTSIVINAQDEDEQEEADEEEKNRRALFADRSNIGIETLGDAVNLNQMIG